MSTKELAGAGFFTALSYAGSFLLLVIPNATLSILLVFYAGYCLGVRNGVIVGTASAILISLFNPYGLAMLPIFLAQVGAYALIGGLGGVGSRWLERAGLRAYMITLGILGAITALIYQVPVSLVDAYLFGPFWERLILSSGFAAITIGSNILFFLLLFPPLAKLKKLGIFQIDREQVKRPGA